MQDQGTGKQIASMTLDELEQVCRRHVTVLSLAQQCGASMREEAKRRVVAAAHAVIDRKLQILKEAQ